MAFLQLVWTSHREHLLCACWLYHAVLLAAFLLKIMGMLASLVFVFVLLVTRGGVTLLHHQWHLLSLVVIIIMLPNQAIASTPSAPRCHWW
jgi:hypothetical protein